MSLQDLRNSKADALYLQYAGPRWYRVVECVNEQGRVPTTRTVETAESRDEAATLLRMAGWMNTRKDTGQGEIWMRPAKGGAA